VIQIGDKNMNMSENINELATALSKAQGEILDASKGAENPYFKSKYADLAAVRAVIREPLAKHGLSIVQLPSTVEGGAIVKTMLMHSSGQFISNELFMPASKADPHGLGSAITYARRYSIMSMLSLAAEDDDGNAAVESVSSKKLTPKIDVAPYIDEGTIAAEKGNDALTAWWKGLPQDVRSAIPTSETSKLKKIAQSAGQ
jgi:ERF superfamily